MAEEKTIGTSGFGSAGAGVPPDTVDEAEKNEADQESPYQTGDVVRHVSLNAKGRITATRKTTGGQFVYTIRLYDASGRKSGVVVATAGDLTRLKSRAVKRTSSKTLAGAAVQVRALADLLRIDHQVTTDEVFRAIEMLTQALRAKEASVIKLPMVMQALNALKAAYQALMRNPRTDVRPKIATAMNALDMVKPPIVGTSRSLARQYKSYKLILLADFLAEAQQTSPEEWPEVIAQAQADLDAMYGPPSSTKAAREDSVLRDHLSRVAEVGGDAEQAMAVLADAHSEVCSLLELAGVNYAAYQGQSDAE